MKNLCGYIALASLLLLVISCKETESERSLKQETLRFADFENSLPLGFDYLQDSISVEMALKTMKDSTLTYRELAFKSEEVKLQNLTILEQELEQSIGSSQAISYVGSLKELKENLNGARYDSVSFGTSSRMEQYDSINAQVLAYLMDIRRELPELSNHARATLVYDEFVEYDKNDFFVRKRHNDFAKTYNRIISVYNLQDEYEYLPMFYGE